MYLLATNSKRSKFYLRPGLYFVKLFFFDQNVMLNVNCKRHRLTRTSKLRVAAIDRCCLHYLLIVHNAPNKSAIAGRRPFYKANICTKHTSIIVIQCLHIVEVYPSEISRRPFVQIFCGAISKWLF